MSTIENAAKPAGAVKKGIDFIRFTLGQRIEHAVLIISFTMLAVTGVPQKFFETGWARFLINDVFGGIVSTRNIHHFFAVLIVVESVYHVGYAIYMFGVKRHRPSMVPTPKDIKDALQSIAYYFGIAKEPPKFDRYDYRQKFEYWGLVWGTAIMILTGFIMWYPVAITQWVPGSLVPAAKAAHGGEAILAVLTIVIWHMYWTHANPHNFPADTTMFTGRISKERMEEEHPLELERLMAAGTAPSASTEGAAENPVSPNSTKEAY
jgi:formate dehydrogenase subunit gamma